MDAEGIKDIVKNLMLDDRLLWDFYMLITDCDVKITNAINATKKEILSNRWLCRKHPHLEKCSDTVYRSFCKGHFNKILVKRLTQHLHDYKKEYNIARLPNNCGVTKIVSYVCVAFTDILANFDSYKDRSEMMDQLLDHLCENSNHDTALCKLRKCTELEISADHVQISKDLKDYLSKHLISWIKKDVLDKLEVVTTTNEIEAINKAITKLLPKNEFHRNVNVVDTMAGITMLRSNHGEIINVDILIELGVPRRLIPKTLIAFWRQNDDGKQNTRDNSNTSEYKTHRSERKSARKEDNASLTKAAKSTRRDKDDLNVFD